MLRLINKLAKVNVFDLGLTYQSVCKLLSTIWNNDFYGCYVSFMFLLITTESW